MATSPSYREQLLHPDRFGSENNSAPKARKETTEVAGVIGSTLPCTSPVNTFRSGYRSGRPANATNRSGRTKLRTSLLSNRVLRLVLLDIHGTVPERRFS